MVSVVHVVTSLKLGGAERFVVDLSDTQRQYGVDTRILSLGQGDDVLVEEVRKKNIPLVIYPGVLGRLRVFGRIYRCLLTADVVHIHNPYALQYVMPLLLFLSPRKIIYTRHGEGYAALRWRIFHWVVERFVDVATFVSQSARECFSQKFGWAPHKLLTIENGVYLPCMQVSEKRHPIRFGSVGRLVEVKGHRYLLEAIDQLHRGELPGKPSGQEKGFEFHVFGDGPLEVDLKQLKAANSNAETINFHGAVIDRDRIYRSIDVLVVSSQSEGLSLAILEAMARGIPVIATAVGGNVDLVQENVSGYLVNYGDVAAMVNAFEQFIDDPALIDVLGAPARKLVADRYSLEKTHEAYLECYSSLKTL